MHPKDLGAVWSGSALFAQTYLSENLGSLRYHSTLNPVDEIWRLMSYIVESKAENYENLFIVKFRKNLRKCIILEMLCFFLCSVYVCIKQSSDFA